jgi:hypothetical protein
MPSLGIQVGDTFSLLNAQVYKMLSFNCKNNMQQAHKCKQELLAQNNILFLLTCLNLHWTDSPLEIDCN